MIFTSADRNSTDTRVSSYTWNVSRGHCGRLRGGRTAPAPEAAPHPSNGQAHASPDRARRAVCGRRESRTPPRPGGRPRPPTPPRTADTRPSRRPSPPRSESSPDASAASASNGRPTHRTPPSTSPTASTAHRTPGTTLARPVDRDDDLLSHPACVPPACPAQPVSPCRCSRSITSPADTRKSMLAGVDIGWLPGYGFSRSRDQRGLAETNCRPAVHAVAVRRTVRWWSCEARDVAGRRRD